MTTPTTTKPKARTKRTSVPAVETDAASTTSVVDALADTPPVTDVRQVALAAMEPHPHNPRRDLGDLTGLTAAIRAQGVRQNLLVVPHPDPESPALYRIVIGHRRAAAAALAGLDTVPAAVDDTLSEADQLELMLLENVQRTDLSPVEEADGYQGLLDLGLTVAAIVDRTGVSETTVRSRLRLCALPEAAREAVHAHRATLEDAHALSEFDDDAAAQALLADALGTVDFDHALAKARRVRETRALFAPWIDVLDTVGAGRLPDESYSSPDGTVRAFTMSTWSVTTGYPEGDWNVRGDWATEVLQQATADWRWRLSNSELTVYRPYTAEEIAESARREATRDKGESPSEVQSRDREREADRQARWAEHAKVTGTTRRDFIRGLLARKQLTQSETRSLVVFVGYELLLAGWTDEYETVNPSAEQVDTWLEVDLDAVVAQANDDDLDPFDATDQAIRSAIGDMAPTHRLLAALAASNEPIPWRRWSHPYRALRAWYALLEELGYAVSDAERAALATTAEGGESS